MDRRLAELGEAERYMHTTLNEILERLHLTMIAIEENDFITSPATIAHINKKTIEVQDGIYSLLERNYEED